MSWPRATSTLLASLLLNSTLFVVGRSNRRLPGYNRDAALRRSSAGGVGLERASSYLVTDRGSELKQGSLAAKQYRSYDEYVQHQAGKLHEQFDRIKWRDGEQEKGYQTFFESKRDLFEGKSVLCLGARLGGEVRALDKAGALAIGLDLEPGPRNKHVLVGDFHDLQFGDGRFDMVFTNVVDHAFDLEALRKEICRVLKPGGVFLMDYAVPKDDKAPSTKKKASWEALDDTDKDALVRELRMTEKTRHEWTLLKGGKGEERTMLFLECNKD